MNVLALFLCGPVLSLGEEARAPCNLEISIRPHAKEIVFGDPLYVEVTIINRGKEAMSGLSEPGGAPTVALQVAWGRTDTQMIMRNPQGDYFGPHRLEPGQTVKLYQYYFLPPWHLFKHPFWEQPHEVGEIRVAGLYSPRISPVALLSRGHFVSVKRRDEDEIAALAHWRKREVKAEEYKKGPTPADFGLGVHTANGKQMGEFAFDAMLDGELGGLVGLSLRLRDLYDSAEQAREGGNRELVEWLRKQPDVKREVLLRELRSLASSYNMSSTFKALGGIDRNRPGEGAAPWPAEKASATGRDGAGAKPGTLDQLIEEVRALREEIRHLREEVEKRRGHKEEPENDDPFGPFSSLVPELRSETHLCESAKGGSGLDM